MGAGAVANVDQGGFHHLLDPNRTWRNNKRLIALNGWIVLFLITSSTNGYDGSMMNGLQSLDQWNRAFNYPNGSKLGLLSAIQVRDSEHAHAWLWLTLVTHSQNIGSLAAYPFAPYLSDGIGRKRTIWIGAVIMVIATVLQTASQSVGMFIGARFLIGFGLTLAANAAPMLVTELAYPPYRASLTSLYNSLWYSGNIVYVPVTHPSHGFV
jgi:MFS family permease